MMPTYDELARLLRTLVQAVHATLGMEDLPLTRETGDLLVAVSDSQKALAKFQPPAPQTTAQAAQTTVTPDPVEDGSVIHL